MKHKERLFWVFLTVFLLACAVHPVAKVKAISRNAERYLHIFHEVAAFIQADYVESVDDRKLFVGAIRGLLSSLGDPHTRFLDQDEFQEHKDETRGTFGGIGVEVTYRQGSILVISPIDDTPAMRAGLLPQDRIIEIDGKKTKTMNITDAVRIMRGKIGTRVRIKVLRKGVPELIPFSLERELVRINYIKSKFLEKEKLGYIRLSQFMGLKTTAKDFKKRVDAFLKKGAKGLIVDLRMNPGGLLNMANELSDYFLPAGKVIVSVKGRGGELIRAFKAKESHPQVENIPMVVLIDKGSASASEIFAGAMKDHKRAKILGVTSFGKGSVQNIYSLPYNTGLALTIQKYYMPSGISIHKKGVLPDIVVQPLKPSDLERVYLLRMNKAKFIETFVQKHPGGYSDKNIRLFLQEVRKQKYNVSEKIAKLFLKREYSLGRKQPAFDLEFDVQLQKAVQILQ
ncbi:MAG: S41 family peptidase [Spirochaetota bacterium]